MAEPLEAVPLEQVRLTDSFWAPRIETNRTAGVPHSLNMCEVSGGRISNFRRVLGELDGDYDGIFFNDSDLYKCLQGGALALRITPDAGLEAQLDGIIDLIARAQREDGYVNTYIQLALVGRVPGGAGPLDYPWGDLISKHELYCAGHLIEAAVDHRIATGRDNFLDVAKKLADHIDSVFGPNKRHGMPGHEELEVALMRLWRLTGEKRYLDLARFFIAERGDHTYRTIYGEYCQDLDRLAVSSEPLGHCVRACYFYRAAADLAGVDGNRAYAAALDRLWQSTVERKMYVTGGIGHNCYNEGFPPDDDLSNVNTYSETCASIALGLWAHQMLLLHPDGAIGDMMERVLYNGYLSGVSLDGVNYFYRNPTISHGTHERSPWQGCACCPSNVVRALPTVPELFYAVKPGEGIWVNLYAAGTADVPYDCGTGAAGVVHLRQETSYPWQGNVKVFVDPENAGAFTLRLRIPGWCEAPSAMLNGAPVDVAGSTEKGYLTITRAWAPGDMVELDLPMLPRRIRCGPEVVATRGQVALARGPVVYCLEAVDNPSSVLQAILPAGAAVTAEHVPGLLGGVTVLHAQGIDNGAGTTVDLTAVPYYAWCNRGQGEMTVWIPETAAALSPAPDPGRLAGATVTYSHCYENDTPGAVCDGIVPAEGGEHQGIPRFTWWSHKGTTEWVALEFAQPLRIWRTDVMWFVDDDQGGDCGLPESLALEYHDGTTWRPAELLHDYAGMADYLAKYHFTILRFRPVTTRRVRLTVKLRPERSGGVLEWRFPE